jgi:predicted nucleic acid-binding protein
VIILDTNVLSELLRDGANPRVMAWAETQLPGRLATTVINAAELAAGRAAMPPGRRQDALAQATERLIARGLGGRVLAVGPEAVDAFARCWARRRAMGRPLAPMDGLIAAVALSCGASAIATRDIADFEGCGVALINPWEG